MIPQWCLTHLLPSQAANFLFGAAAEPHDLLHEPLFRILSSGLLTAGFTAFALRVSNHRIT